jgi:hypothetical protein
MSNVYINEQIEFGSQMNFARAVIHCVGVSLVSMGVTGDAMGNGEAVRANGRYVNSYSSC